MTKSESVFHAENRFREGASEEELFDELLELTGKSEITVRNYIADAKELLNSEIAKETKKEIEKDEAESKKSSKDVKEDDPLANFIIKAEEKGTVILLVEEMAFSETETEGEYPNITPKKVSKPYILKINPMQYVRMFSGEAPPSTALSLKVHKVLNMPKGVQSLH